MRRSRHAWPSNCDHVQYGLAVSLSKFDLAKLKKEIRRMTDQSRHWIKRDDVLIGVAPTRNILQADYHVHFNCHWTKRDFHATIGYFRGIERSQRDNKGPFAEDIMMWLGKFFRSEKATASVTVAFKYHEKKWAANLPLPIRLPIGLSREVEVVGMVANIPSKPEGVYETFVRLSDHKLLVVLRANRPVMFRRFHLRGDVAPLSSVAKLFAREINK